MGTNKPGEIALLTSLVNPTAALITNIGRGHLEFFSSLKGVAQEKLTLFRMMHRGGTAFLNQDDKMIRRARIRRNISVNFSLQTRTTRGVQGELLHLDKQGCGIWRLNNKTQIHMQIPVHNVHAPTAAKSALE
jgi:UDP-N-acetylmuramoyl-tripeptide--D-alanyl-D-alanine ligase